MNKSIKVTQINGIRKIPSQPLIFPNENNILSLIDSSYT